jgi:hypothetical protein
MRPLRILISGVYSAIPLTLLLTSGVLMAPKHVNAQCPAGSTAMSTSYTKSISGPGATTTSFTMPQFDPSPGGYTLLSAVLSSTATTNVTTTYKNTSVYIDFFPGFSRSDIVKVNGTTAAHITTPNDPPETMLNAAGTAGDQVTYSPPISSFSNTGMISTTITNATTLTGTYQGTGTVAFTYITGFSNTIPAGISISNTLSDNTTFTLTYNYCNPIALASNILNFTANKMNSQTVDLKWLTANEQPGRNYYIEVSSAGRDFAITGSVPSNTSSTDASYTYVYSIPPAATGKLYFRLRQVDADGTTTWSDIRIVNLDGNGLGFSIYPNPPSDFINLTIPGNSQDWQVDIFAADGRLVQRNSYRNSNAPRVNFGRRLAASTYFVRATNPQTGKHYTGSFVVSK